MDAISGEFKPMEVVITLWAYETIGRKPRERMMGQMEWRVKTISGDFSSHHVSNTPWATSCFGTCQGYASVYCRFCCPVGI